MAIKTNLILVVLIISLLAFPFNGAGQGLTVKDEIGRELSLPAFPQRIVALTPSLVEILFALGLEDKLVGATTWADFPPRARKLPRVGSYVMPNMERIVALAPDLVLVNREGNPPWVLDKLNQAGIPVYVTVPDSPAKLPDGLERLGRLCGAAQRGKELAAQMRQKYGLVEKRLQGTPPKPCLLVIGSRPLVTVSPDSFSGRLLTMAGAKNIAPRGAGKWPRLSLEYVIKSRPRVVIVSTMERGQDLDREMNLWRKMPGLAGDPAYRVGHVPSDLIDRPGPRLSQGLLQMAQLIHPRLFSGKDEKP